MSDADRVFTEFKLDKRTKGDIRGILDSFKNQCILGRGEVAPADPGKAKPNPSATGTLYYKLGGVYPIAQFADRLVELVLRGDKVQIQSCSTADAGVRHPPGLK